jgi:hypothetical protein
MIVANIRKKISEYEKQTPKEERKTEDVYNKILNRIPPRKRKTRCNVDSF